MGVALLVDLSGGGLLLLTCLILLLGGSSGLGFLVFSILVLFICLRVKVLWWWRGRCGRCLNGNLDFFSPFLDKVSGFKLRNLVNVVFNFELELNFAASLDILLLRLANSDLVLSNLVGESLKNLSVVRVLDEEGHIAELVVKSDSLLKREHTGSIKDLLGILGTIISETVLDADGQSVVLLNNEASN